MNNKQAKKIRKIAGDLSDPTIRRVYRRIKKQFTKVPSSSKALFLDMFAETLNGK
jgi:hypothetical protein